MMVTWLVGMTLLAGLGSDSLGFNDFSRRPEVPWEATSFEQDDLIKIASGMEGDNVEQAPIEACEALIADESLVFELRSWAVRQKMKLCSYARREWDALATGREWLAQYGDKDPHALAIRAVMGQIVSQRRHHDFIPLYDDVRAVFEDLFENHPPNTMLVIQGHINYARALEQLSWTDPMLRATGVQHTAQAVAALEAHMSERGDALSDAERRRYQSRIQNINALTTRLMMTGGPQMTEEEYIAVWQKGRENTHRIDRRDIESGAVRLEEMR